MSNPQDANNSYSSEASSTSELGWVDDLAAPKMKIKYNLSGVHTFVPMAQKIRQDGFYSD